MNETKVISNERGDYLEGLAEYFQQEKKQVLTGLDRSEEINYLQKKIKNALGASQKDWNNWHWQLAHRISQPAVLSQIITNLPAEYAKGISLVGDKFRWGISPYYLSLIDSQDDTCPISRMSFPTEQELLITGGQLDPMNESHTNPAGSITRRYPDRVIINTTNICASFCRFCQRRRLIGQRDTPTPRQQILDSIAYIRANKGIRDVLITGGDPFTLEDSYLEWLLKELYSIPHLEYCRIGTRVLVTMPQRITGDLCKILKKYKPLYINTHFNHPREITKQTEPCVGRLVDAGIPLGNQSVMLNGVNDSTVTLKYLFQLLLQHRIKPYYLFHPKLVTGTLHFYCPISRGLEIMRQLRGTTSGMAIPTYVLNAKDGLGKIPLLPPYVQTKQPGEYILTTWEGKEFIYSDREIEDHGDFKSNTLR